MAKVHFLEAWSDLSTLMVRIHVDAAARHLEALLLIFLLDLGRASGFVSFLFHLQNGAGGT